MMPRKVCFIKSWSTITLLAISMLFGVAHAAQRELKEVRVAYPPSMASVTLMTGIKQKFFEEQAYAARDRQQFGFEEPSGGRDRLYAVWRRHGHGRGSTGLADQSRAP